MHRQRIYPYLLAVALVSLAALFRASLLGSWMGDRAPLGLFTMAIIFAAWKGGLLPGLFATVLSIAMGSLLFIAPHSFTPQHFTILGIFLVNGCLISLVCGSMLESRKKAEAAREEVELGQSQLRESEGRFRQLAEIEHAARLEAERTAVLKDEFLATVSHEMRTPLTAMLGWVQLLRNGSLTGDSIPKALETIERNARAQAKLIDDLLDMSRILSGRLRLDVHRVSPAETVEAAIAAAEPAAAAKNIQLTSHLDFRVGLVPGDATRLQQIIWNLLSNAIKFTPSGGEVTVAVTDLKSRVEISVSDTGEGIEPKFLPHVFDRFRQQDASTVRKHQGLGLGLSIVKQLVELHGGSVRVESEGSGKGTNFVVSLPVMAGSEPTEQISERPAARPECSSSGEPLPSLLGAKVLVVDDDNDARELIRSILAQNGASVRTADSAPEALKQLQARCPDVLVSDIGMPGQDGYELIRSVRALDHESGGKVPAVALTAFARSDDRRRAIGAGFQMHLSKPIEAAELVTVIASLVKR